MMQRRVSPTRALIACTLALPLGLPAVGCGGGAEYAPPPTPAERRSRTLEESGEQREVRNLCDATGDDLETSEYDTSGDTEPDVRKVFRRMGDPPLQTSVLVCREVDLNGDGIKDVVRTYTDEGRPLREEADRNFDGQMDEITIFQNGRIVRVDEDTNNDGRVDTKTFFRDGKKERAERDLAGRSTPQEWRPDRWEYYDERGQLVRMGNDLDGDGLVDRWDRDEDYRRRQEAEERRQALERAQENATLPEGEGEAPGAGDDADEDGGGEG